MSGSLCVIGEQANRQTVGQTRILLSGFLGSIMGMLTDLIFIFIPFMHRIDFSILLLYIEIEIKV